MNITQKFNALNGVRVSRSELKNLVQEAKNQNNTEIIYRISKVLNAHPEAEYFELEIQQYPNQTGLGAARHLGNYKEALDDCGRLKKGWKFVNGSVVKVEKKERKSPKNTKTSPKKEVKNEKITEKISNITFDNKPTNLDIYLGNQKKENTSAEEIKDIYKKKLNKILRINKGFVNANEFDFKAPKSTQTGLESLKNIVAKSHFSEGLEGVLIEKDTYVATDSYKLVVLKRQKNDGLQTGKVYKINDSYVKYFKTEENPVSQEKWEKEIRHTDLKFPNYKTVFPKIVHKSSYVEIDPLIEYAYKGSFVLKNYYDFAKGLFHSQGHKFCFQLIHLFEILQCLRANGAKHIRFEFDQKKHSILITCKENENKALLMVVNSEEGNVNSVYIGEAGMELSRKRNFNAQTPEIALSAPDGLYGLEYLPHEETHELLGLGKAVSPEQIYKMVTEKVMASLKKATGKGYVKKWKSKSLSFTIPINFVTKRPYRGVNFAMLKADLPDSIFGVFENPYFLTFNQVKELKGKVKKGAKGKEVIYFSFHYKVFTKQNGKKKILFQTFDIHEAREFLQAKGLSEKENLDKFPILKYYNVYNGNDVEGIDFQLDKIEVGKLVPEDSPENKAANLMVKNYPNPPKIHHGGDRAFYRPADDWVQMPLYSDFETANDYYRTLLHELTHSTGHEKRLNRDLSGRFGSKSYAQEELVAEFGAIFLSAFAGIMWHTNKNHTEYLKNWNKIFEISDKDNKFLMKGASMAQKAADHILNLDENGEPKFYKDLAKNCKTCEKSKNEIRFNDLDLSEFEPYQKNEMVRKKLGLGKEYQGKIYVEKYIVETYHYGAKFHKTKQDIRIGKLDDCQKIELDGRILFISKKKTLDYFTEENAEVRRKVAEEIRKKTRGERKVKEIEKLSKKKFSTEISSKNIEQLEKYIKANEKELLKNFNAVQRLKQIYPHTEGLTELTTQKDIKEYLRNMSRNFGGASITTRQAREVYEYHARYLELKKKQQEAEQYLRLLVLKKKENALAAPTAQTSETISFNKEILKAKKEGINENKTYSLGKAQGELQKIIGNKNITIKGKVIKKAMEKDSDHIATFEHFINLPDALNFPVAIFRSKTQNASFVVLTELKNYKEKPLMVALHLSNDLEVSKIASLYSKRSFTTYQKWYNEGLYEYINKKSELSKRLFNCSNCNSVESSHCKNTKKTEKTNFGLGFSAENEIFVEKTSEEVENFTEKSSVPARRGSIAEQMSKQPQIVESFQIFRPDMQQFLGDLEKKNHDSLVITLTGGQGSGKTRFAFQFINDLGQAYKVGHISNEEHPQSRLYAEKVKQYLNPIAQANTEAHDVSSVEELHEIIRRNEVVVIDSFQKIRELDPKFEVDKDLRKKYDGKLFLVIFQQTTDGKMRGGAKSQFDGDIILFTEKFENYQQNFVYPNKNRYNSTPLHLLKYGIFNQKLEASQEFQPTGNQVFNIV